jgi:hypothetical protein
MRSLTRTMTHIAITPPPDEISAMVMRSTLAGAYANARGRRNRRAPLPPMPPCGVSKIAMRAAKATEREKIRAERLAKNRAKVLPPP